MISRKLHGLVTFSDRWPWHLTLMFKSGQDMMHNASSDWLWQHYMSLQVEKLLKFMTINDNNSWQSSSETATNKIQHKFKRQLKENTANTDKKWGVYDTFSEKNNAKLLKSWFTSPTHSFFVVAGTSGVSYVESTSSAYLLLPFWNARHDRSR